MTGGKITHLKYVGENIYTQYHKISGHNICFNILSVEYLLWNRRIFKQRGYKDNECDTHIRGMHSLMTLRVGNLRDIACIL